MTNRRTNTKGSAVTELAWLLRGALAAHRTAAAVALSRRGHGTLPPLALWALDALAGGELGAGELARQLGVSKQAVTQLVDLLAARGYVERCPNPRDRRRVNLRLTREGRAVAAVIAGAASWVEARVREEIDGETLEQARVALRTLAATIAR